MNRAHILIVEDNHNLRKSLITILSSSDNYEISQALNGEFALDMLFKGEIEKPDMILLDVMMPKVDGFEVIRKIKENNDTSDIPVIFLTGSTEIEHKIKAFDFGCVDYITKPFDMFEVIARVRTHLKIKFMSDNLNELVREKTEKIEHMNISLVSALENVNLYNDTDTGNHIKRVSRYAEILATEYGAAPDFVKRISLYATLHDIGKVGIPSTLLKKEGIFTKEEFEEMKKHVTIGVKMLDSGALDIMAKNIILHHHEKWDGTGYVSGLKGSDIPLEARIVALADVYDALTTKRIYKKAFSECEADKMILENRGKHFEPKLVDLYFTHKNQFLQIRELYSAGLDQESRPQQLLSSV